MAYYPPVGFHFRVEFGLSGIGTGDADARFQSVSGLDQALTVFEIEEGGENRFKHRVPNRPSYGNLILKRGMLTDSKLIAWFRNAVEHFIFLPIDLRVTLLNESHEPLQSWTFRNAWPVKWSVSEFNAQENGLVSETIELAYSYFKRD